jgi:hypothetical protein
MSDIVDAILYLEQAGVVMGRMSTVARAHVIEPAEREKRRHWTVPVAYGVSADMFAVKFSVSRGRAFFTSQDRTEWCSNILSVLTRSKMRPLTALGSLALNQRAFASGDRSLRAWLCQVISKATGIGKF